MTWLLSLPGKLAAAFGAALFTALMFAAGKWLGKGEGREDAEREARDNALDAERSRARTDRDAGGELLDDFHRD